MTLLGEEDPKLPSQAEVDLPCQGPHDDPCTGGKGEFWGDCRQELKTDCLQGAIGLIRLKPPWVLKQELGLYWAPAELKEEAMLGLA